MKTNDHWLDALTVDLPRHRFAAQFANGVQLDLVILPAQWRTGHIIDEEVPVVDKDVVLEGRWGPPPDVAANRLARNALEWVMLGWWAVSDIAKYLRRN